MTSGEQLVVRWEDQRTLKNLMGKYVNSVLLNHETEIFGQFWSTRPDVCLGFNQGWHNGRGAVRAFYNAVHVRNTQVSQLLKARFPEQLGGIDQLELTGIGPFKVLPVACPLIEVAGDRETAKGLFFCHGAWSDVYTYGPRAHWTWGFYAADYTREQNEWRLWHLQWVNDVDSPAGQSWGKHVAELPDLPEFEALRDYPFPPPNVPMVLREAYHPKRPLTGAPRLPEPYQTFSDTFSYGIEE
jgi:hypothetical protein